MLQYTLENLSAFTGMDYDTLDLYKKEGLLDSQRDIDQAQAYEYEELLTPQQMMLYRERSVSLYDIKEHLESEQSDLLSRLHDHRLHLLEESQRIHSLIQSVDRTIESLKLDEELEPSRLFQGFSKDKQCEKEMGEIFAFSKEKKVAESDLKWQDDYLSSQETLDKINRQLEQAMEKGLTPSSEEVQCTVRLHLNWVRQFYTPTADIYKGLANLYVEQTEYRAVYNRYYPGMAEYIRESMLILADRELE